MPQEVGESAFADAGIPMAFVAPSQQQGGLGPIVAANAAMAYLTGRSLEKLNGLSFSELLHPDDVQLSEDQIKRLRNGEIETCSFEKRFEHADGHRVWGLVTVALANQRNSIMHGNLIVQVHDISERKHFVGQLEFFADHDPLTSLYNQRRFRIDVDRQLAYGRRHGGCGVVLMLDLDHFKTINDHYGHAAGDALIVAIAAALKNVSRETDVVARLGGDEFAILLPESNLKDAHKHALKILKAIEDVVVTGAGTGIRVAASCGLAGFEADDGQCADDVMINADLALYQAKESGRGQVQVFHSDSGLHEKVRARLLWSERIKEALDNDGFVLHAKPVINLITDEVAYYELSIRLKGPGGILIPPTVFLYTAERFGMAVDIDKWATSRAIKILSEAQPDSPLALAVNISSSSLQGDSFFNFVASELGNATFNKARLIFEINESIAMANLERARLFGTKVGDLGCRLALDDFGAAFGSFYYLKHLPVDLLKISGDYVRGLGTESDPTDRLIIEAVVKLANGLGTTVVAEFVGDMKTRSDLIAMGVELGQGDFLGTAQNVDDIESFNTNMPPRPANLEDKSCTQQGHRYGESNDLHHQHEH